MSEIADLFVIGGGINGSGIARDAAGRGLSVILCEKDDLAQGTSSRSSKLLHGGLRYLEYYEFRLVREALRERDVLLANAPHVVWPLRFVLPHSPNDRPAWLVRLGLFLYDHLAPGMTLKGTRTLNLMKAPEGAPIKDGFRKAFEYSDCWVDDSRLVVLNAMDAAERGAQILTRTECLSARRVGALWQIELRHKDGSNFTVQARVLVNAAGPWVSDIIGRVAGLKAPRNVRLVKGSHIVVHKFWEGSHAYVVRSDDKRVIFVIPYEDDLALIGTTDVPYDGKPEDVSADADEIDCLTAVVNRYFTNQLRPEDVLHSFSGVRPLYDDRADNPSAVTRDYVLELDAAPGQSPLLSVFGGKITSFRKLSEHALQRLETFFPAMGAPWTAKSPLPGGDMAYADFETFLAGIEHAHDWLPESLARHYARLYGTRVAIVIGSANSMSDLGHCFGPDFYEAEVRYLIRHEWAQSADDILVRRTKHGLHLSAEGRSAFERWFASSGAVA